MAAPEVGGIPDPDIDGAQVWPDVAPIVGFLARGIDDLQNPDRATVDLGDQQLAPVDRTGQLALPVELGEVTGRFEDVRLPAPGAQDREVGGGGVAEFHGKSKDTGMWPQRDRVA